MEPVALHQRLSFVLRRAIMTVLRRFRHAFAIAVQAMQRNEIGSLRDETRAFGAASVESVSHVGAELREINERLSKLERDIARLGSIEAESGDEPLGDRDKTSARP